MKPLQSSEAFQSSQRQAYETTKESYLRMFTALLEVQDGKFNKLNRAGVVCSDKLHLIVTKNTKVKAAWRTWVNQHRTGQLTTFADTAWILHYTRHIPRTLKIDPTGDEATTFRNLDEALDNAIRASLGSRVGGWVIIQADKQRFDANPLTMTCRCTTCGERQIIKHRKIETTRCRACGAGDSRANKVVYINAQGQLSLTKMPDAVGVARVYEGGWYSAVEGTDLTNIPKNFTVDEEKLQDLVRQQEQEQEQEQEGEQKEKPSQQPSSTELDFDE